MQISLYIRIINIIALGIYKIYDYKDAVRKQHSTSEVNRTSNTVQA